MTATYRRVVFLIISGLLLSSVIFLFWPNGRHIAFAATNAAVTSPAIDQEVNGQLDLVGTASADDPAFDYYIIEYGAGATPVSWKRYGDKHFTEVLNGTLETINTLRLSNQTYTFKVTVFDNEGNSSAAGVRVIVRNPLRPAAPHGNYQVDSDLCALCHGSHTAIFSPGILHFAATKYQSQLCYTCHNGSASIYNVAGEFDVSASRHPIKDMAFEDDPTHTLDCSDCHDPHGTEESAGKPYPRLLRTHTGPSTFVYSGNEFCYTCHGEDGAVKDMRFFETDNGHNNTDAGQTISFTEPASGTKIKCSQCHAPHGSAQPHIKVVAGKALCEPCHPDSAYTTRNDNEVVVGVGYPDTAFGQPYYAAARVFSQDTFSAPPVSLAGPREYRVPDSVFGAGFSPKTRAVCVGDANNDGKNEIIMTVADGTESALVIGAQDSDGYSIKPLVTLEGYGGYGVAVGNIDNIPGNEVIVTSLGSPGQITVIKINSSNEVTSHYHVATNGADPRDVVIANLDNTGYPEVVVSNYGSDDLALFRFNETQLELVESGVPSGGLHPYALAAGDVNEDTLQEIVVGNQHYENVNTLTQDPPYLLDNVVVFSGSTGSLIATKIINKDSRTATVGWDIAIGDVVDGSVGNEIVVAGKPLWPTGKTVNGSVTVLNVNDNSVRSYDALDTDTKGIAIGDVNGDGLADVVALNGNSISVFPHGVADLEAASTYRTSGMNASGIVDEPGPVAIGNVGKLHPYGHRAEVYGECALCHDPHAVTKAAPIYGATGLEPLYETPTVYGAVAHVVKDYQLCYKCHSGGAVPMTGPRDTAEEFNPDNDSYHSVMAAGRRGDIPNASFVGTWDAFSRLKCGDCHGNDALAPNQIKHGSANAFNLRRPYAGQSPLDPGLLCYMCHNPDFYGPGTATAGPYAWSRAGSSNNHMAHSNYGIDCATCHDVHGSASTAGIIRPSMNMSGAAPGPFTCTTGCH